MAYRSTRGNYGRTRSSTTNENYSSPVYSTQAGYQPPAASQPSTPQQSVTAVKPEYDSQSKRDEYEAPKQAKTPAPTQVPAAQTPEPNAPMQEDGGDEKSDKPWKRRIFQKLPKKVKKKRLNAKLRNLLAPKNAMMVLHELHPGLSCTANEEPLGTGQTSYTVVIDIDGKQYKGIGLSKVQAKQTACETALKAALFEKMAQSATLKAESPGSAPAAAAAPMETNDCETPSNGDANSTGTPRTRKPPEEDDVPWGSLASYALFKLFSEWQAQGYTLPTSPGRLQGLRPPSNQGFTQWGLEVASTIVGEQQGSQMPMKKMPADASQRHPVQLLNQLKPHAQYFESRDGNPPNMVFTFTVTFDGQTFTGVGPNKKDSKKACAKNALISLGIQYVD